MLGLHGAVRQLLQVCSRATGNSPYRQFSNTAYDVIVLGMGAHGSAAAYHLGLQGARVLALDMYRPGHPWGSSHGHTRIIRLAYFEGQEYVKLIKRSYKLFLDLQEAVQEQLFVRTGMLDVGATFDRALASTRDHGIPHEILTAAQVNSRFPGYQVPEGMPCLYQPDGGILCPEDIIKAHCRLAVQHGVTHRTGDRVVSWQAGSTPTAGVVVQLASGERVTGQQLVMSAGPWLSQLLPEIKNLCKPERQVVAWFDCPKDQFRPDSFPVFIIGSSAEACYYGFPEFGEQPGFKLGSTHQFAFSKRHEVVNPDTLERGCITAQDEALLRHGVRRFFPAADGKLLHFAVCFYTNTPDGNFIIDRHPKHEQVIICSACSGHGFKMSSGIGQLLADMVVHGGQGSAAIQEELRLHRISPLRAGHQELLSACMR